MTANKERAVENLKLNQIKTYQSGVVQSAAHRILKKLTDDSLREHGLTTMQWFIMGTIYDAGKKGIRITDLSKQVGTTLGFLTNTINGLESRGWLERAGHSTDSRAKMVLVTEQFMSVCDTIELDLRNKLRNSIYKEVTPEELTIYVRVLYKFSKLSVGLPTDARH